MTGSTTRMLPLLLLLFISFHQSFSSSKCRLSELIRNVADLGNSVKGCSENCSSADIIDRKCKCLNLSVTQQGCTSYPAYFAEALRSLDDSISKQDYIEDLIIILNKTVEQCTGIKHCELSVEYEPLISPKSLHRKLDSLSKKISALASTTQQRQ